MVHDRHLIDRAAKLLNACRNRDLKLATAESCTGGLIAATLTEIAGASDVVERGFITYSNAAKTELLGVPASLIRENGAVSHEVARAMADGAIARSEAELAVSVTGIAGPGGATPGKPVGLVFLGVARRGKPASSERRVFSGDRRSVRRQTVERAFELLMGLIETAKP